MTDAPVKIWRWAVQNCGGFIEYSDFPVISEHSKEYTRTDVTEARIKELEAALRLIEGGVVAMNQPADKAMRSVARAALKGEET